MLWQLHTPASGEAVGPADHFLRPGILIPFLMRHKPIVPAPKNCKCVIKHIFSYYLRAGSASKLIGAGPAAPVLCQGRVSLWHKRWETVAWIHFGVGEGSLGDESCLGC